MSFFLAGRDTTASTLSFAFMLLAQHPEAQSKLQTEVTEKLGSQGAFPTVQDLADMPYLTGVIMETLRLFPPVPVDGKQVRCTYKS